MREGLLEIRSHIRRSLARVRGAGLRWLGGMDVGEGCRISPRARLDRSNPRGVHIGKYTDVFFNADIMAYDSIHDEPVDTWIGECCQIGPFAIVYPGVRIGEGSIVATGAVVTRDVPDHCLVAGNPARVLEKDIKTGKFGVKLGAVPPEVQEERPIVLEGAAARLRT